MASSPRRFLSLKPRSLCACVCVRNACVFVYVCVCAEGEKAALLACLSLIETDSLMQLPLKETHTAAVLVMVF